MNPKTNDYSYESETNEPVSFENDGLTQTLAPDQDGGLEGLEYPKSTVDLYADTEPEKVAADFSGAIGNVVSEYKEAA